MSQFSILEKQNLEKIRSIFDSVSNDGVTLRPKELLKFINQLGLNNQFFLKDISYYFPEVQAGQALTFDQILRFLDYILTSETNKIDNMEAFKSFDRMGTGQISSAELLGVLKRRLPPKEYETYVQLLSSSYGPLINYIDFFKKLKTTK